MRKFKIESLILLIGIIVISMVFAPKVYANSNRVIVVFDPSSSPGERRNIVLQSGCSIVRGLSIVPAVVVYLPEQASEKAREAILGHYSVVRIDDDVIVNAFPKPQNRGRPKPPKDKEPQPAETLPWGVDRIDADLAWVDSTGSAVKVAILDTGIDIGHPDLSVNIDGGTNIINPRKSYKDDNGHGTHVAGIVAAVDNEIGVIGVAKEAKLYGVKVLDRKGRGWLSDVVAGLEWCVDNHMQVVNMSLGTPYDIETFADAVYAVYQAGIVQVAAAGNESSYVNYPAAYLETIAVSATDNQDNVTSWSNYGAEIDLAAPGVEINSTYKGSEYAVLDGTSMAAPHVTGTVALVLENQPTYTPDEVSEVLRNTADDLDITPAKQGAGLVDAEEAASVTNP